MDYFMRNVTEMRKAGLYDADIIITTILKGGGMILDKFLM